MKIALDHIELTSTHLMQRSQNRNESLRVWTGDDRPATDGETPAVTDRVTLSPQARNRLPSPSVTLPAKPKDLADGTAAEDPRLTTMRLILEALTGKRFTVARLEERPQQGSPPSQLLTPPSGESPEHPPGKAGWGLEYDFHQRLEEHEALDFSAQGPIRTEDGRDIEVSLAMTMHRDFVVESSLQIRAGDALLVDPLVINFSGNAPGLTDQTFAFDLDMDQAPEQIHFLTPGSGFLFLDNNRDRQATNGSELFGPTTGSGFAELALLDTDGNGWLDESDPMFANLSVWAKDAVGSDYFAPLSAFRIGAILLDRQVTPFRLTDRQNSLLGQVAESSLFLREDGSGGTVQEINLAL